MLALALAFAPVVAIIWYILFLDTLNREPLRMILLTFVYGLLSVLPALLFTSVGSHYLGDISSLAKVGLQAFVVVGLSEELSKYLFLRLSVYKRKEFDEPYDGIVYAVMISMGFAAIENFLFVMQGGLDVAIVRMFTAVPAHATFAILMGYWVGKAKMDNKPYLNWLGLFSAVLFHGAYDLFLLNALFEGQIIGALVSLAVAIVLSRSAIRKHREHKIFYEKE